MRRETVPAALAGERLDRVVAMVAGVSRREAAALVTGGAVRLDGRVVTAVAHRVREGDELELPEPEPAPAGPEPDPTVDVPVVHEDPDVVVVDKPAGLVVHPGPGRERGTLVHGLLARYPDLADLGADPGEGDDDAEGGAEGGFGVDASRPGIVHRLDKGTSGLLVVARTPAAYASLVEQLSARTVERTYAALVWGHPDPPRGVIDAPIGRSPRHPTRMAVTAGGRPARTRYATRAAYREPAVVALLECRLETGRTHQIRVHLAAVGHPVVGDDQYGGRRPGAGLTLERPFLHAEALAFTHPRTGERVAFRSALPGDLALVLDGLR